MMNILIYAMQMEKDGEEYYYELAEKAPNKGLKAILEMLAVEESRHYRALEKMQTARPKMAETTVLTDAKNVFAQIKESGESFGVDLGQIELYRKAQDIEQKSIDFYSEKADEVEHKYQKEVFLILAEEEKKHYALLENIIEFVSRPKMWLENAEFHHLDEY